MSKFKQPFGLWYARSSVLSVVFGSSMTEWSVQISNQYTELQMAIKWSDPQNIYNLIRSAEIILTKWLQTISKYYIHQKAFAGT